MSNLVILFIHLLATLARLLDPGGVRSIVAESLVLKHQLLIVARSRQRSPNLCTSDRILAGLMALLVRPTPAPSEKPALIDGQGRLRDLSEYFADITAESLSDQQLKKVAAIDSESGISPDSNQGSSCLSRRNMILGGAAVVAAISLPKNGSASTPLSTTGQLSKNNDGKDDSMNSTTEIPETARTHSSSIAKPGSPGPKIDRVLADASPRGLVRDSPVELAFHAFAGG